MRARASASVRLHCRPPRSSRLRSRMRSRTLALLGDRSARSSRAWSITNRAGNLPRPRTLATRGVGTFTAVAGPNHGPTNRPAGREVTGSFKGSGGGRWTILSYVNVCRMSALRARAGARRRPTPRTASEHTVACWPCAYGGVLMVVRVHQCETGRPAEPYELVLHLSNYGLRSAVPAPPSRLSRRLASGDHLRLYTARINGEPER